MGKINKNMCPRAGHSLRHCSLRSISRWHATRRCGGCLWTRSAYWWPLARIRGLTFPCRNKGVTVNISFPGTLNSHLNRLPARGQHISRCSTKRSSSAYCKACWPLAGNLFKWLLMRGGSGNGISSSKVCARGTAIFTPFERKGPNLHYCCSFSTGEVAETQGERTSARCARCPGTGHF